MSPGGILNIWDTKTTSHIASYKGVFEESVGFPSDSEELLYLSGNEVLQIIDAATGNSIADFRGHTDRITYAVFSADYQQLASRSKDGSLKIWDRETRECLATYDCSQGNHKTVGFSPDGLTFALISDFESIQLLDSRKTRLRQVINDHNRRVASVVFSPDSQILASVDSIGTLIFRDLLSGTSMVAEGAGVFMDRDVIFLSDGSRLITPDRDHAITLWNTATAKCESKLKGHRTTITEVVLTKDESRMASASYDKTIRIWDRLSGACVAIYTGHDRQIASLAYSADERLLISADQTGHCKVWDLAIESQHVRMESHESAILEVVFSPDKKRLATTSGDRTIKLWNAASGECVGTSKRHQIFAWVPLVVPQDMRSTPYDHVMESRGLSGWPRSVEFSLDGSELISAGYDHEGRGNLRLWNTTTGAYKPLLQGSAFSFRSINLSPDNATLVTTSRGGLVMYWDMRSQKLLRSFEGKIYEVSSAVHSPDGTQIILACNDGVIRQWNPSTGSIGELGEKHEGPVLLTTISADGTKLASYALPKVKIWNTERQMRIASYPTEPFQLTGMISQVQFSPDSRHLGILYEQGDVKVDILNAETGYCVDRLSICGLANHIIFDPNGSSLVTNVGMFIFDQENLPAAVPDGTLSRVSREPKLIGIGLSRDGIWVTWNSINLVWLPPTFRVSASDIAASTLALGSRLGQFLSIEIDPSMLPPLAL